MTRNFNARLAIFTVVCRAKQWGLNEFKRQKLAGIRFDYWKINFPNRQGVKKKRKAFALN